jgi:hypothetical protein
MRLFLRRRKTATHYDENYINLGFTCADEQNEQRPQYAFCYAILADESLKPANVPHHVEANQAAFKNKFPESLCGKCMRRN